MRRAVDLLLAAVCGVAGFWNGLQSGLFEGSPFVDVRVPLPVTGALAVGCAAAVFVRRTRPLLLSAGALACWVVFSAWVALPIAQFAVGAHVRSSRWRIAVTVVTVAACAWPLGRSFGGDAAVPLSTAVCLFPMLAGLYLTSRRKVEAGLREAAARSEREQRLRIEQARAEERAQIARDMHDVVTHRVSLMVLHATALESTHGRDAVAVAGRIQDIGRDALTELRTLVGVLRDGAEAPLRPQPGLADLDELADASRALGLRVALAVPPDLEVASLVGHAVYRVVQEALTNVHKHGGDDARVTVTRAEDALELTVSNRGGPHAALDTRGGHGLIGINERVRLLGGTLTSRSLPSGGFELRASLPVVTP